MRAVLVPKQSDGFTDELSHGQSPLRLLLIRVEIHQRVIEGSRITIIINTISRLYNDALLARIDGL